MAANFVKVWQLKAVLITLNKAKYNMFIFFIPKELSNKVWKQEYVKETKTDQRAEKSPTPPMYLQYSEKNPHKQAFITCS